MDPWAFLSAPVLASTRVLAMATSFPLLAGPGSPRLIRIGVAIALALVVVPGAATGRFPASWMGMTPAQTMLALPLELIIGLAIGYAFSLVFHLLSIAGDFAGQEMGLNAATQIDPVSGRPVPLLARLFEMVGLVLFVETGGLALMLRAVHGSFELIPPGAGVRFDVLAGKLAEGALASVSNGIALALPMGVALLLLSVFSAISARVLPKLHIFDFAFAVRMLVAIFIVSLLLTRLTPFIDRFTEETAGRLEQGLEAR